KEGYGLPDAQKVAKMELVIETPIESFNCPTRRDGGPFANNGGSYHVGNAGFAGPSHMARTDYAANSGDAEHDENFAGPDCLNGCGSPGSGDDPKYAWPSTSDLTGIVFQRSTIRVQDITRGASNTWMVGEKYLQPEHYLNGQDPGDNETMYVGFD